MKLTKRSGYNAASAKAMAQKTARRERVRRMFHDEGLSRKEIEEATGLHRVTINGYLR